MDIRNRQDEIQGIYDAVFGLPHFARMSPADDIFKLVNDSQILIKNLSKIRQTFFKN